MKKWLPLFFLLISISFVSAAGLSDLLDMLNESTVVLSSVFIISFAVIFFSLSKTAFKTNTSIAGIIAVILAFLITYGINKKGFDVQGLFYDIGISEEMLMTIVPIIVLAIAIFIIIKLKGSSLFVFGGLLIALSFFVYEGTLLIVIGVILLIAGLFFLGRKRKEDIIIRRR